MTSPALLEDSLLREQEARPLERSLEPDVDAPYLSAAMRHAQVGRVDEAFRVVFEFGNERTLVGLLQRLDSGEAWPRLAESDAQYLARLLVRLLCKAQIGPTAEEACAWLEALLQAPAGATLLSGEDLRGLQATLFSLSAAPGVAGRSAASVYYMLFERG